MKVACFLKPLAVKFFFILQNWPPSNTAKLSYGGPKDIPEPPIPPVEPSIWTKIYWRLFGKPEGKLLWAANVNLRVMGHFMSKSTSRTENLILLMKYFTFEIS